MSLGKSLQDIYTKKLAECKAKQTELQAAVSAGGEAAAMAQAQLIELSDTVEDVTVKLNAEMEKKEGFKLENKRRKHNYIPFLLKFLKIVAEKGQLAPLVEKAKAQNDK